MKSKVLALLCGYVPQYRQLPQMTGNLFAARTRVGRCAKIVLFGIGVVLPLGSFVWTLLFLHGARVRDESNTLAICDRGVARV